MQAKIQPRYKEKELYRMAEDTGAIFFFLLCDIFYLNWGCGSLAVICWASDWKDVNFESHVHQAGTLSP